MFREVFRTTEILFHVVSNEYQVLMKFSDKASQTNVREMITKYKKNHSLELTTQVLNER